MALAVAAAKNTNIRPFDEEPARKYKDTKDPCILNLLMRHVKNLLAYLAAGVYVNGYDQDDLLNINKKSIDNAMRRVKRKIRKARRDKEDV